MDGCLEKNEVILGGEAGVHCLPSGSHTGEGVEKVKLVCVCLCPSSLALVLSALSRIFLW